MRTKIEIAEAIVRQYAQGLRELDLSLIADILHPEFKFVYRMGGSWAKIIAHPDRMVEAIRRVGVDKGYGIRTDIRYVGHLYRTFLAMKKDGVISINTDFFHTDIDGEQILCIKLLPPHDRRMIYPMDEYLREELRRTPPTGEVCMLPRVMHGLLCKIECYDSMEAFNFHVEGTFNRGIDKEYVRP
jgi:hypothetical protein